MVIQGGNAFTRGKNLFYFKAPKQFLDPKMPWCKAPEASEKIAVQEHHLKGELTYAIANEWLDDKATELHAVPIEAVKGAKPPTGQ